MTTLAELYNALKYRIEVDEYGDRRYFNALGHLHREDGPAVILSTGSEFWYYNGQRHRENGPAIEWHCGSKEWWHHGVNHRNCGPAVIRSDGTKEWWLNGTPYTEQDYHAQLKALGHTV